MIETRPILSKSLTAGAIFATADVSSQVIFTFPSFCYFRFCVCVCVRYFRDLGVWIGV
ncbi:hypothetical protein M6B38_386565 [Iris pallida]|uniref:Uncharacterized protein n=1 Tax=Iris pallida TaxID=29817 RepID=A0AAX6G2J2_IRIPA|nr:hypothetical protein M6B38_386565 [Iris pallida]